MQDRALRWLHSDWCGLFIISMAVLVKGWLYLPFNTTGHEIPAIERFLPTTWAALIWITAGALGLVAVVIKRWGPQMVGVGVGLHSLWAILYMSSWAAGDTPRGHVTAVLYVAFVAMILWGYSSRRDVQVKISEGAMP